MDKALKYTSYKQEKDQTTIIINKKLPKKGIELILPLIEHTVEYLLSVKE